MPMMRSCWLAGSDQRNQGLQFCSRTEKAKVNLCPAFMAFDRVAIRQGPDDLPEVPLKNRSETIRAELASNALRRNTLQWHQRDNNGVDSADHPLSAILLTVVDAPSNSGRSFVCDEPR